MLLFPVHAIGFKELGVANDFVAFTASTSGSHVSQSKPSETKYRFSIPLLENSIPTFSNIDSDLFIDIQPDRESLDGWLGHLSSTGGSSKEPDVRTNCIVVPLPGATPLCALVATIDVPENTPLVRPFSSQSTKYRHRLSTFARKVERRYSAEILENWRPIFRWLTLSPFYLCLNQSVSPLDLGEESNSDNLDNDNRDFEHPFHRTNEGYLGIQRANTDPVVWIVPGFLSESECDALQRKASRRMTSCVTKNADTSRVYKDLSRTSTNTNVPRREVPTVVSKLKNLTLCDDEARFEILQVLRYQAGQHFSPHTDGFSGPITACGFWDSGRLVTVFCYLNDVEKGGTTRFNKIPLEIRPQKGTAVLHFPSTVGLEEDRRTVHEGSIAADEKWLLVTWLWRDSLHISAYDEVNLPGLSEEIV
jgi:prolyl 4-hydroxylase